MQVPVRDRDRSRVKRALLFRVKDRSFDSDQRSGAYQEELVIQGGKQAQGGNGRPVPARFQPVFVGCFGKLPAVDGAN
jgi:hypothetical protein